MTSNFRRCARNLGRTCGLMVLSLTFLFSSAARLNAQALSGINGTVTDTSGAVIPNAHVTVTNIATQVSTKATTTSAGEYRITDLVPGTYTVKVEVSGFADYVLNGLHIDVGTVETANAALKPGATTQEVEVDSPAIALETAEPELGTTITLSSPAEGESPFIMEARCEKVKLPCRPLSLPVMRSIAT